MRALIITVMESSAHVVISFENEQLSTQKVRRTVYACQSLVLYITCVNAICIRITNPKYNYTFNELIQENNLFLIVNLIIIATDNIDYFPLMNIFGSYCVSNLRDREYIFAPGRNSKLIERRARKVIIAL